MSEDTPAPERPAPERPAPERPASERPAPERPTPETGVVVTVNFMLGNKVNTLSWLTRIGTIVFTFLAVIPIFDIKFYSCYQRALLCNAATGALRLHQRMPPVRLTREYLGLLLVEDSCHYLLFSLLFIYANPITMALQPIFLFACVHSASYTSLLCQNLGLWSCAAKLTQIINRQLRNILRFVALSEIALLPLVIFAIFTGKGSLLTPFAYYRLLTLRYASRRNPYTKNLFRELRVIMEQFANTPGRSPRIRDLCLKVVSTVSMLAPPLPAET